MKTPIKRVSVKEDKIAIVHVCSQVERLKRIEEVLVGDGHPEEGYIYKVIEMGKEIKDINIHLTGISGIVKDLHEESIGKKATGIFKDVTFGRIATITGIIIAIVMMWIGYKSLKQDAIATKSEVEITNDVLFNGQTRGQFYDPFTKDTVK